MMEEKISLMPTIAIHTASPFKDLFPIKESVLNEIAEDMKQNGFDFAIRSSSGPVTKSQ